MGVFKPTSITGGRHLVGTKWLGLMGLFIGCDGDAFWGLKQDNGDIHAKYPSIL